MNFENVLDILPAPEKGTIDAAEWCCPKPDMDFGFHKVCLLYTSDAADE